MSNSNVNQQAKLKKEKISDGISNLLIQDYNSNSFPLINNKKLNDVDANSNNYYNNSSFSSPIFMKGTLGKSLISNDSIRITNKMTTSLKTVLDKLDSVPELDEKIAQGDHIRNENNLNFMKNISNRRFQKFKSLSDLEEINKFNFSIINNKNWGLESLNLGKSDSQKLNLPKPNKKTLSKELGKN